MFTFVAIGLSMRKKRVVAYSLISSLLFLLIFNPIFLFDVGFQLSYLAVFGIIWVQPKFYNIWQPKNYLIDKLWQLFTVSVAAQVGILPLSLFYFHQFPGLFVLSNLIIIPFLGVILFGGILVMLLAYFEVLPAIVANIYESIIWLMNSIISWIAHQESFLLKDISFSFLMMLVSYFLLFSGVHFLMNKKAKNLLICLIALVSFQGVILFEKYRSSYTEEFIVFHKSRSSIFGIRKDNNFLIQHQLDSVEVQNLKLINNYEVGENVKANFEKGFQNLYQFQYEKILVIDSLGIYNINNLKSPIVVLQNSPKINLMRLIRELKPKQIIADGSNYKSYVNRWELTAKKTKTPFHYTGQNGAFIIK